MIEIIPFTEEKKEYIKLLNYEWLEKYFKVEPHDVVQLTNPQKEIIDKGGLIFYAKYNNEIVGTYSLIKVNDAEYELAKMAVTENCKGVGIGKIMMEHCINEAKKIHATILSLFSNTKLEAAIHLYKKYGFVEVDLPADVHYERANIKMEKIL
jgi:N-acetylglutamate synthase-like GNAT family acetyltransferase